MKFMGPITYLNTPCERAIRLWYFLFRIRGASPMSKLAIF